MTGARSRYGTSASETDESFRTNTNRHDIGFAAEERFVVKMAALGFALRPSEAQPGEHAQFRRLDWRFGPRLYIESRSRSSDCFDAAGGWAHPDAMVPASKLRWAEHIAFFIVWHSQDEALTNCVWCENMPSSLCRFEAKRADPTRSYQFEDTFHVPARFLGVGWTELAHRIECSEQRRLAT